MPDDIQAAIAEAVAGADLGAIQAPMSAERGTEESGAAPDADSAQPPVAPGESQSSRAETPSEGTPPEAVGAVQEEDVPTSYWGVDLTDIPADKRAAIIAASEQQEGYIKQLQAKLAAEPEPVAPNEETPEPVTDEDILRAFGIDPEQAQFNEMSGPLVAMARAQMALEEQVQRMETIETGRQAETAWNRSLNELESTYGPIPAELGSREDILRYAVRENIQSPAELYFAVTAPVRQQVQQAASAARRVAPDKREAAGLRPRGVTGVEPALPKDASLRDIVKAAAAAAEKETGVKWSGIGPAAE